MATLTISRPPFQVPGDAAATATPGDVPRGVFGPLVAQQPIDYDQLQDEDEDEDPLPPPPPAKITAAATTAITGPNGVDVDKAQPQSTPQQQQLPLLPPPPQSQHAQPQLQQSQSLTQQSQAQAQSTSAQSNTPSQPNNAPAASLKRQVDAQQGQLPNGTPAKRPRLGSAINGAVVENGVDTATSPMDVDPHQSDNHAYPSPLEGEQAPTPAPRTEGPDHATQIDKVEELGPKTIYLRLTPDESLPSSASSVAAEASRAHNHSPILLQCEWNPKDPTRLAAAGTDALARVWTLSQASTGPEQPSQPQVAANHVADREDPNCPNINLVNTDDIPPNSKVTAFSWAYDGHRIAVATEDEQTARIGLCNLQGGEEHHWEGFEAPIVKLRCNPYNRTILSVSPATIKNSSNQPDGWTVSVMSSLTGTGPVEHRLTGHDVFLDEPDVTWMNATDFLLCVGTKMVQLRYAGDAIAQVRDFATRPDDPLTAVQYDGSQEAGYIAAATSSGHIDVSYPCALVLLRFVADVCSRYGMRQARGSLVPTTHLPTMAASRSCSGSRGKTFATANDSWLPAARTVSSPYEMLAIPTRSQSLR